MPTPWKSFVPKAWTLKIVVEFHEVIHTLQLQAIVYAIEPQYFYNHVGAKLMGSTIENNFKFEKHRTLFIQLNKFCLNHNIGTNCFLLIRHMEH